MAENEPKPFKDLKEDPSFVAKFSHFDDDFFGGVGESATSALILRNVTALDKIYGDLSSKRISFESSDMPIETRYRLNGSAKQVEMGTTCLKLHKDSKDLYIRDYQSSMVGEKRHAKNMATLQESQDAILQNEDMSKFEDIAKIAAISIILSDAKDVHIAYGHLKWIIYESKSLQVKQHAKGMVDVLKPASDRMEIFTKY
jgi:hypothetical protein